MMEESHGVPVYCSFDPTQKAKTEIEEAAKNFIKKYLRQVGKYLQTELQISDIPDVRFFGPFNDGVEFAGPIIVGKFRFRIFMNCDYPKIRCHFFDSSWYTGDNFDSQTPKSLVKKLKPK